MIHYSMFKMRKINNGYTSFYPPLRPYFWMQGQRSCQLPTFNNFCVQQSKYSVSPTFCDPSRIGCLFALPFTIIADSIHHSPHQSSLKKLHTGSQGAKPGTLGVKPHIWKSRSISCLLPLEPGAHSTTHILPDRLQCLLRHTQPTSKETQPSPTTRQEADGIVNALNRT